MKLISILLACILSTSQPIFPEWYSISLTPSWGIVKVKDSFTREWLYEHDFNFEGQEIHTEPYSLQQSIEYMTIFVFEDCLVWSFNCRKGMHEEGWVIKVFVDGRKEVEEKLTHHMCIRIPKGSDYSFEARVDYPELPGEVYIKLEVFHVLTFLDNKK
jgi:hypothetical protein